MSGSLDVSRLKFVDESGVNLAMTRLYGRAPKGVRVVGAVPHNYGQHVTILGALSLAGVGAVMTVAGAPMPRCLAPISNTSSLPPWSQAIL